MSEEFERRWQELIASHPAMEQMIYRDAVLHAAVHHLIFQPEWSLPKAMGEMLKVLSESKWEVVARFSDHLARHAAPTIAGCALLPIEEGCR